MTLWFGVSSSHAMLNEDLDPYENVRRLTTPQEHVEALEDAFSRASKTILVTNYGNLYSSILRTNLFQNLIPAARQKNVKIYLRCNYDTHRERSHEPISSAVRDYLDFYGINVAWTQTHAKIVAVDHELVMMGSYNWLTDLTSPYPSLNSSLVYEGRQTYEMTERIWEVLKYYRNKEFSEENKANYKKAYLFKRDPLKQESNTYTLKNGSKLTYVPLIDEHRYNLLELFEKVTQRIVILSPFVSLDGVNTYQRDFVRSLLTTVLRKNIEVCFVCLPEHESKIRSFLDPLLGLYPTLKLLTYPHLHAKTAIVDDKLIAEGSFNWLCAARDEVYRSHKHEATLVCEGPTASKFIIDFYKTELGKSILRRFSDERFSQAYRKRRRTQTDLKAELFPKIKRQRLISLKSTKDREFFVHRKEEIKEDMWVHHPFWVNYSGEYIYLIYKQYLEIMSGKPFNRAGYCVRVNKQQYITNGPEISYFKTPLEAKKAAYSIWSCQ
jgi:hypothetical protein